MELKHTAARAGRLSSILREDMAVSLGLMNKLNGRISFWSTAYRSTRIMLCSPEM